MVAVDKFQKHFNVGMDDHESWLYSLTVSTAAVNHRHQHHTAPTSLSTTKVSANISLYLSVFV